MPACRVWTDDRGPCPQREGPDSARPRACEVQRRKLTRAEVTGSARRTRSVPAAPNVLGRSADVVDHGADHLGFVG